MRRIRLILLVGVVAIALTPGGAGAASAATTERASVGPAEAEANGDNSRPEISANGRYVAFRSEANNLVAGDANGTGDIYTRDLQNGDTVRISLDTGGLDPNSFSGDPDVSASGRFVTFRSGASDLVPGDTGVIDIFVRDRDTDGDGLFDEPAASIITRVSNDTAGGEPNGTSSFPTISADGRFVVFESDATDLVASDLNGLKDTFVRDRVTNATERVSVDAAGSDSDGSSFSPHISDSGRFVVFTSVATDLGPVGDTALFDVYVRDRQTGTTTRLSVDQAGGNADADAFAQAISSTGRFVVFHSAATDIVPGFGGLSKVFVRDRDTDADGFFDEIGAAATTVVSVDTAGTVANNHSYNGAISGDGRYVGFMSPASDLVAGDTNQLHDIFIRDRLAGYTVRASVSSDGDEALFTEGANDEPSISAEGIVAFDSTAFNLVPDDGNYKRDIFVRSADADGDGILTPVDNCEFANPDQLDTDGDGLGDECDFDPDNDGIFGDLCHLIPEDLDGFQDGDGCPEPDNDQDGICDAGQASISCTGSDVGKSAFYAPGHSHGDPASVDCRNQPEDVDAFKDNDGCPEPDNDNDGRPDGIDVCPGTGDVTGADGMLGSGEDQNHNGKLDTGEDTVVVDGALTTDDSVKTFEDYDGVIDTDGCHDSPTDDYDGDSFGIQQGGMFVFRDEREVYFGTNPEFRCAVTAAANDEAGADHWPFDFDDNQIAGLTDVIKFVPVFNTATGGDPAKQRFDFNGNGTIGLTDVQLYVQVFNTNCVR